MSVPKSLSINVACVSVFFVFALFMGCGKPPKGDRKETVPVTGKVLVDGQTPSSPIKIMCHDKSGIDQEKPSVSWCLTDKDGAFSISTYESGDGVPPGSYILTFFWGNMNNVSMSYGGPDQLGGKYDEPKEAPVEFEATAGEELVDLGTIELTSKKK